MKTVKISRQENFPEIIKVAKKAIKEGKILICPTDTVYGLIGDATNKKAVEKIFRIKKKPKNKPIPIFVKDLKMAKKLAKIDKKQEEFLRKVWFTRPNFSKGVQKKMVKIGPKIWAGKGKVTTVLTKKRIKIFGVGRRTIGLRIPNYKLINQLLLIINRPLTATSANISGKPASTKIKEVLKQFGYKYSHGRIRISRGRRPRVALFACPDLVIDAGNLKKSKPSKVIDLTQSPPKILRY